MRIGVPKEIHPGERRVATTPRVVADLIGLGFDVSVETGAGEAASFTDESYAAAGATIEASAHGLWDRSDILLKVRAPEIHSEHAYDEVDYFHAGQALIGFLWPGQNSELLQRLAGRGVTALAIDSVPRISRAQKLDALSSMSNIAGYRAVVEAAQHYGRFLGGQITAAGRIEPARVLVIGAGVAGLAAIGAAKSMGAIVRAFDTRLEVAEQIESLNAEFLELDFEEEGSGAGGYAKVMSKEFIDAEMALFRAQAEEVDIIITTALIPGKPAPKLITADMVRAMKRGSVIVDLAAEQGGNCELTVPGQISVADGVTLIGYTDMPSRLSNQASELYATNLKHLVAELCPDKNGSLVVDMDDEVIRSATVVKDGEVTWPPPQKPAAKPAPPRPEPARPEPAAPAKAARAPAWVGPAVMLGLGAVLLALVGATAPPSFVDHFTVFVLACFVGYMVVWNVTPSLHTPLMSVTNAISSIIIIGALLQISAEDRLIAGIAGFVVLITAVNIFGGFGVTRRMLAMFRK
ncbi:MAG TPA: Re/Si-specific NAD(P)(+) transhydrogenase subunit alpha [Gammaproteobacteria bacterium]|nr:Re/Si-specific NAD(P)(+) transhydrogenase subunit alpha [Gammaproteobacteria bacterium]